jgi:hypothetical protein
LLSQKWKKKHNFVKSQVFCRLAKKHFINFVLDKGQTGKKKDETIWSRTNAWEFSLLHCWIQP